MFSVLPFLLSFVFRICYALCFVHSPAGPIIIIIVSNNDDYEALDKHHRRFAVFFISYETFILNSSCVLLLVFYTSFKGFFYLFGQRILNFPDMDGERGLGLKSYAQSAV